MDPSYFEKVAKSANALLTSWDGSCVLVRELTVSLRTLEIVLFADRRQSDHAAAEPDCGR